MRKNLRKIEKIRQKTRKNERFSKFMCLYSKEVRGIGGEFNRKEGNGKRVNETILKEGSSCKINKLDS